ncbi:WD40 repeat domain-containing serine/threonine protein kinase [Nonomuraea sp. NPDC048916]|uniref:WD40 repeat domain-containing serine/threonine protein kinase n=1 Tax=Nonomuraea sp. NPDC048916 TaxID=3154232 RepID=UPI0033C2DE08
MPSFAPLRPGDPPRLAGLDLLGRLGEGGQGVVYLARDPSGEHVAVKWLRPDLAADEVSVGRFLREVQVAQQVAPFCTAAVLGTGIEHDRPYIVSEFIDGPSLQQVVLQEGPRTGSSLQRLAVGTATALAAIHQAGIVHRDFKPANVILGADGPRVIDFGIARALDATSTISGMPVGTPSYMPPEQIMGHTVGPAADLFSWAGTMVFAASSRAPFGSDTMPAVLHRVLSQDPDVGVLDGPLRDVVLACLAKDPARRPTAEQVIMRLLQRASPNPGILAQAAAVATPSPPPAFPPPGASPMDSPPPPVAPASAAFPTSQPPFPPSLSGPHPPVPLHSAPYSSGPHQPGPHQPGFQPRPPRKGKGAVIIGVTVAVAVLMLAAVAVAVSRQQPQLAAPSATPTTRVPQRTTPTPVPANPVKRKLPGGAITLYEHPSDAIILTSYEIYDKKSDEWQDYARKSLRGTFTKYAANWESLVSPDGHRLASRGRNYTSDSYDSVIITDRRTGARSTVKTVRDPLISSLRSWSKDGSKLLLNIERKKGDDWVYLGFVIVDVAGADATVVNVADGSIRGTAFGWDGDEEGVVNVYGKDEGLRFFDAAGKAVRDAPGVGTLASGTQDIFSPSGKLFVTNCPKGGDGDHCLWDSATGEQVRTFSSGCDKILGWYDETHLFCWEQDDATNDEIQVVDFGGKLVRKLLEIPGELDFSPVFTVNPARGS